MTYNYTFEQIEEKVKNLSINLVNGGKYFTSKTMNCDSNLRIAIIVPYRDRDPNLRFFLSNMHPFMKRQNVTYGIYLVEPVKDITFNRGLLMNIGFIESMRNNYNLNMSYWNCFIFHDVDMIPEDERLFYHCDKDVPVHIAVAVSKFGYRYPYLNIFNSLD